MEAVGHISLVLMGEVRARHTHAGVPGEEMVFEAIGLDLTF